MKPVNDIISPDLDVLFIGFNPSIKSSETGHHFANRSNRFWKILHESGLTPYQYLPEQDQELLELNYGLTNIVARPTKAADEITKEEYNEGRLLLAEKLQTYQPKIACYVGKGVYEQLAKKKKIPWGIQETSVVPGIIDFVAPSSSGLVRMKLNEIVDIYKLVNKQLTELQQ
ncbi:G/U mismatch-specific DNA glycosylase [Cytobacillus gottheilii]|uniref:G/U mismatch-specific DNA glycosylase n=1 Tax=Cytobacillus gottheilii TaxID=859144 RepID=A0ABX8F5W7_9BACI|nr:G/U mismatch-specific DNA glycosylase [Cytobacillus gottheilii]QVY59825.1 G/U mismatch-specific DNA glycosylase [Cytobacillus gottheilii]